MSEPVRLAQNFPFFYFIEMGDKLQYLEQREMLQVHNSTLVAHLRVFAGGEVIEEQRLPIYAGTTIVGSAVQFVNLPIKGLGVSSIHAIIEVTDGHHFIEDLDSTNGTYLGKSFQLLPRRLYQILNNNEIMFGPTRCRYEYEQDPEADLVSQDLFQMEQQIEISSNSVAAKLDETHESFEIASADLALESIQNDLEIRPTSPVKENSSRRRSPTCAGGNEVSTKIVASKKGKKLLNAKELGESEIDDERRKEIQVKNRRKTSIKANNSNSNDVEDEQTSDMGRIELKSSAVDPRMEDAPPNQATTSPQSVKQNSIPKLSKKAPLSMRKRKDPGKSATETHDVESLNIVEDVDADKLDMEVDDLIKNQDENESNSTIENEVQKPLKNPPLKTYSKRGKQRKSMVTKVLENSELQNENVKPQLEAPVKEPLKPTIDLQSLVGNETIPESERADIDTPANQPPKRQRKTVTPKIATIATKGNSSSRRRQESETQYRIMFTGLKTNISQAKLKALGAETVDDWQQCTHLVTDKIRRTTKFLCCLAAGKKIMDVKWLEISLVKNALVNEQEYYLKDDINEKKYNINLQASMEKANKTRIFEGLEFYATLSVMPPEDDMRAMIQAAGGKVLTFKNS